MNVLVLKWPQEYFLLILCPMRRYKNKCKIGLQVFGAESHDVSLPRTAGSGEWQWKQVLAGLKQRSSTRSFRRSLLLPEKKLQPKAQSGISKVVANPTEWPCTNCDKIYRPRIGLPCHMRKYHWTAASTTTAQSGALKIQMLLRSSVKTQKATHM